MSGEYIELNDDDVVVVIRRSIDDESLHVFSSIDESYSDDEQYMTMARTGALMAALPSFLSSSEANRKAYMDYIYAHHPDIFEGFLDIHMRKP